ncbi:hypothetical protein J1614_007000 [Plenodomus biglobosus]|nr:hypothetical protein J1614_007000 [Plenodomus biglobosus]
MDADDSFVNAGTICGGIKRSRFGMRNWRRGMQLRWASAGSDASPLAVRAPNSRVASVRTSKAQGTWRGVLKLGSLFVCSESLG